MADRIYHWKHGWIPLDHRAAISKSKGSELGARRYLAASHAAGHAHESVVRGAYGGGTHERGLQPVAAGHLKRESHITAAFNPVTRRFGLQDPSGRQGNFDAQAHGFKQGTVTTSIPEHLAEHFNAKDYRITRLAKTGDGTHRVIVQTPAGGLKSFNADGSDKERVDPTMIEPPSAPKPPPRPRATRATPTPAGAPTMHTETHTIVMRTPTTGGVGGRTYGVIKPIEGFGSVDVINGGVAQHILDNHHKVINYRNKTITTQDPAGVVRRFKANGSNLDKPTIVKNLGKTGNSKPIGGWESHQPNGSLDSVPGMEGLSSARVQGGIYRKGNKSVVIEPRLTEVEKTAFLAHVDEAFDATKSETSHPIVIHVPSGDSTFRSGHTLGYVVRGNVSRVHISPKVAKESAHTDLRGSRSATSGHFMAAAKNVHPSVYTLTHELGHIVDNKHAHSENLGKADGDEYPFRGGVLFGTSTPPGILSNYGSHSKHEAYAEAFAHHHLADRGTPSPTRPAGASKLTPPQLAPEGPNDVGHDQRAAEYASKYGWTPRQGWRGVTDAELRKAILAGDSSARAEGKRRGMWMPGR